ELSARRMSLSFILAPLFVQVALTLGLIVWLATLRLRDFKTGAADPKQVALGDPAWPAQTRRVGNAFANQFELPVLFYLLTILEIVTHHADHLFVALAWIFVASRLVHAFEFVTSNVVMRRGAIFGFGL